MAAQLNNSYTLSGITSLTNIINALGEFKDVNIEHELAKLLNTELGKLSKEQLEKVVKKAGSKHIYEDRKISFEKFIESAKKYISQLEEEYTHAGEKFISYLNCDEMTSNLRVDINENIQSANLILYIFEEMQNQKLRNAQDAPFNF